MRPCQLCSLFPRLRLWHYELCLTIRERLMLRSEPYKYVWNRDDLAELYDLQMDPGELNNRAGVSTFVYRWPTKGP